MSQFGQEFSPNDAPALPLWVDGRACLMMATDFHLVVNRGGQALRRVPLYGAEAVAMVTESTARAVPVWREFTADQRATAFRALVELLARYRAHFGKLLEDETGIANDLAESELARAIAAIGDRSGDRSGDAAVGSGIAAITSDAAAPLALPLACAIEALAAGWGVILKPSTKAPSALFAMAELFTRAGFPAGLVNCVHGDEQVIRALCADQAIAALVFSGDAGVGDRVAAIARESGKPCLLVPPEAASPAAWRALLGRGR